MIGNTIGGRSLQTTRNWFDTFSLVLLAVIVGGVTAYASLGFLVAIGLLHELFVGGSGDTLYSHLAEISPVFLFMVPVVVSLIVTYGVPGRRNYGPADVIQAARHGDGKMSAREGLTNAAASIVSIGSGASVGRYGPVVHLGATLPRGWLNDVIWMKIVVRRFLRAAWLVLFPHHFQHPWRVLFLHMKWWLGVSAFARLCPLLFLLL